jgi:hypothetical protein
LYSMKKAKVVILIGLFSLVALAGPAWWFGVDSQRIRRFFDRNEPDIPAKGGVDKDEIDKAEYLMMRGEQLDLYQGFDTAEQDSRPRAIAELEQQERVLERKRGEGLDAPALAWTPLGPTPIPISATNAYSGRTTAIAAHPTNPSIVYVGTAQGGLYRTLDGGGTWTPLMDNAQSLAIGAVAISPSNPSTIYVGTGESTQCGSGCFIGVGVYRIDNAETSPVLTGPLNKDASNTDIFGGRAISEILIHPTDPNKIFVGTTSGIAGIGANTTGLALPPIGLYRSTNAATGSPVFEKISLGITDRNVTDLVMDPADPNRIWVGVITLTAGDGGVFVTTNALDPVPGFSQALSTTNPTGANSRVELAAANVGGVTTVYAATGQDTGTIYRSVNYVTPFTPLINNGFCGGQCFYDIAVAVDATNPNNVYLGGGPAPGLVFGRSTNGGTSFTNSATVIGGGSLHVDTQVFAVSPSNPNVIYFGSDGGIWKSVDSGTSWTTLNKAGYSATQFMSIAIHPVDPNYSLGGTQDNGTELYTPQGAWLNSDGGDGGFAVVDQTSTNLVDIVAYHTYFNQKGTQIGFNRGSARIRRQATRSGPPLWDAAAGAAQSQTA